MCRGNTPGIDICARRWGLDGKVLSQTDQPNYAVSTKGVYEIQGRAGTSRGVVFGIEHTAQLERKNRNTV